MIGLLLPLSLVVLLPARAAAPVLRQEIAAPAEGVPATEIPRFPDAWAVFHAGDGRLRDALVLAGDVWHDAGLFLVGAFAAETIDGLATRGVESVRLGPSDLTGDLWLVSDEEIERLGGKLSPLGAELLRAPGGRLVRVPAGTVPRAAVSPALPFSHVAMTRIERRAWMPKRPKHWAGAGRAGHERTVAGYDDRIQALVDQVSGTNLLGTVSSLSALHDRRADRSGARTARDMIRGWLAGFGLSTRLEWFSSIYAENVIAEIPGTRYPNEWVLIGAHYDSINHSGSSAAAPGADDNASGTAGVVEAARILAGAGPFERSLRFIGFCAEEMGLIGSAASATNSENAGEDIVAMINIDMNAYRKAGDTREPDFVTNGTDGPLTTFAKEVGGLYVPGWSWKELYLMAGSSDHASYSARGFPAIFPFEDQAYSPYIHTANDTTALSAIDWDLAAMIVKGALATAVARAELVDMQIDHTPLPDTTTTQGPFLVSATATNLDGATVQGMELHYTADLGLTWTETDMVPAGGGAFTGWIPSFGSPIQIDYYLAATDDQGSWEFAPEDVDAGGLPYSFFVGTRTVIYATGFEGDDAAGWTWTGYPTHEGWMRSRPFGKAGDASYAYEGGKVWGTDSGVLSYDGMYEPNNDATLSSPSIDCTGRENVFLEFHRWLAIEDAAHDQAQVLVNGVVVWENETGADHLDGTWIPVSLDVSAIAAGEPAVVVQFRLLADQVVEYGGWNIDAFSLVEKHAGSGDLGTYGSGVNPPGSMVILAGTPALGDAFVLGLDNPLGTQSPGAATTLFLSLAPDPAYPAGTLVPGWGMAGPGAEGELLIGVVSPDPVLVLAGPAWTGPGAPATIAVSVPNDPGLAGTYVYGQGLLFDPSAALGVRYGLTEAVLVHIVP
ncbi:MAG: M20/M25/M40 family metallo-hydrolase [Planctomycetota bacterium]